MKSILILNANIVNEGSIIQGDVLIKDGFIQKIDKNLSGEEAEEIIDADGKYLLPGLIDDQVHFREPGLTHKGNIYTESRAAVAGGVTSFMEMPNTVPNATTVELLEDKYAIASKSSLANYSFFMGGSNDNLEELKKVDKNTVCGVKVFMGSSTGNMLVDDEVVLSNIFSQIDMLIATHCEKTPIIKQNEKDFLAKYGEDLPIKYHPLIRSEEACYASSSQAVGLAKKYGTRLHILHISTAKELELFDNSLPLEEKKITSEACVHHLWFSDADYDKKGTHIKWNPAVKTAQDRDAIFQAVLDDKIDVIATDHAPHTLEEKNNSYFKAPSGGPLVQHSLQALIDFHKSGKISLEKIVEKACHNPAKLFQIKERGFIREGFWADLVLVDLKQKEKVSKENILYKCKWSPFEGHEFQSKISLTIVSGHVAYRDGQLDEKVLGKRLKFLR
ncbi:dihydroorotase [Flexithrix dorotheae]|uniref:dihydroorotase n=1 Tax=Flexithrix dorotheae TaxID=70993 RepID=UPI000374DAC9|nr:dihydroorotase [Flexithrix dorotheae]